MILFTFLYGCNNFLDVSPKSEVFDDEMFSSAEGYEDALFGVYGELGSEDYLYGKYVSLLIPEAKSVNFETKGTTDISYMSYNQWSQPSVTNTLGTIWTKAYQAVGHVNNIIEHAEAETDNTYQYMKLYKGEAYALRAFIHFDLLRLYAVTPNSLNEEAKKKAIPYVVEYSHKITPYSSVNEVYNKIIDDLKKAESLLDADESLIPQVRNNSSAGGFISSRITHLNLYAVQGMLARVYWMKGDLQDASIYAKKVIDCGKFPLMEKADLLTFERGVMNLKETVFGIYSIKYPSDCYLYLKYGGQLTLNSNYKELYEVPTMYGNDERLSAWFDQAQDVCYKMMNNAYAPDNKGVYTGNSILGFNVIRIPEMYYIMAEALLDGNLPLATQYFDKVIASRGMLGLADRPEQLTADHIYMERRKEFYGEGQQWFNMKRLGKDVVLDASVILDGSLDETYKLPIPISVEDGNRW